MDNGLFATSAIILFQFRKNKAKIKQITRKVTFSLKYGNRFIVKNNTHNFPFFLSFSMTAVTKNNVFMPSSFCEPSTGNSDSEPGELPYFSDFFLELLIC